MKVLQVVSSFAPAYAYGGVPRSSYQISKNLSEFGHDVTVYTTDAYDADQRFDERVHETPEAGFDVHRFRNVSNTLAYEFNLCFAPGMAAELRRTIDSFDIIHIQEFRTVQAAMARWFATKADVPYVLQTRGGTPRTLKRQQKILYDRLAGRRLFADAARIIASSESESGRYFEVFPDTDPEKVVHVPNGVDMGEYSDLERVGSFRERFGVQGDHPVVLFVGRIDEMKGIDLLVEAFDGIDESVPDAKLFVVGPDDGVQSDLERQTKRLGLDASVTFPGPLYGDEKLAAYSDADLFVLPSKYQYESFGNVAIEALACGTPVILTEKCGASEWIPPEAGRTVRADTKEIRAAIADLLGDEALREEMGEYGRNLVADKFTWESVAQQTETVYRDVLAEKTGTIT